MCILLVIINDDSSMPKHKYVATVCTIRYILYTCVYSFNILELFFINIIVYGSPSELYILVLELSSVSCYYYSISVCLLWFSITHTHVFFYL